MKKSAALLAIAALMAPAAMAEPEVQVGAGYSIFDGDDGTLGGITGRASLFFNDYFGIEGEVAFGVDGDEIEGVELELNNQYAAYLVGRLPAGQNFEFLGRVGYGSMDFEGTIPGFGSESVDVDGFAYGVGGQYFFTERLGIRGDITRFEADDEDIDGGIDTYTVGVVLRF